MTAAAGWSPWRPSHIHLIVSAEGHEPLVTQLFIDTSDYLHDDVASAVKDELIVHPEPTGKGDELGFSYDFVLAPAHGRATHRPQPHTAPRRNTWCGRAARWERTHPSIQPVSVEKAEEPQPTQSARTRATSRPPTRKAEHQGTTAKPLQ